MIAVDASARRIAQAYERWGKGINPAALNFGDCFAYEEAKEHGCPLLFVGNDFAGTESKVCFEFRILSPELKRLIAS